MSFVPYKTNPGIWKDLEAESYGKQFYPLQQGNGTSIKIVSPAQGSLQRAKSELKRQITESEIHSPPRKRRKKTTSDTSKPRKKNTKKKKKKPVKKLKKGNKKTKKKNNNKTSNKRGKKKKVKTKKKKKKGQV